MHFDRPLVAGCSIDHKPRPLHLIEWDASQTQKKKKKLNYTSNNIFPKTVFFYVILGSSDHAELHRLVAPTDVIVNNHFWHILALFFYSGRKR